MKILVVDPIYDSREPVVRELEARGHEVETAIESRSVRKLFIKFRPDAVLVDRRIPDAIRLVAALSQSTAVFYMGEGLDWKEVRDALRSGAVDCLEKPLSDAAFARLEKPNVNDDAPDSALSDTSSIEERIIGDDPSFHRVLDTVNRVADTDTTVLITGESGTGKEMIARLIHDRSPRRRGPFIPVNCGAIPDNLLESELFGHVKGAFTGAVDNRPGVFGAAQGGTVFLDEIGEMSPNLQVKLLRVLQEFEYTPVGDYRPRKADVRIVAATNRDLQKSMENGDFRLDLYYRLSVVVIRLPSLRERQADIVPLFHFFRERYNRRTGRELEGLTQEAEKLLMTYRWPGNIRELENLVERLVVLKGEGLVDVMDLPEHMRTGNFDGSTLPMPRLAPGGLSLKTTLESIENRLILDALLKTRGNRNRAASLLGMNRTTLVEKLKKKPELTAELEKRLKGESLTKDQ